MSNVFDIAVKEIDQRIDGLTQTLVDGRANDFAEYKRMCGEIRGLLFARETTKALAKKMESDDE